MQSTTLRAMPGLPKSGEWLLGTFRHQHSKSTRALYCLPACRQELVPLLQQLQQQRAQMAVSQAATAEWEQFLSCSPLPDPHDRPAMNAFLSSTLEETDTGNLQKTLQQCEVVAVLPDSWCLYTMAMRSLFQQCFTGGSGGGIARQAWVSQQQPMCKVMQLGLMTAFQCSAGCCRCCCRHA